MKCFPREKGCRMPRVKPYPAKAGIWMQSLTGRAPWPASPCPEREKLREGACDLPMLLSGTTARVLEGLCPEAIMHRFRDRAPLERAVRQASVWSFQSFSASCFWYRIACHFVSSDQKKGRSQKLQPCYLLFWLPKTDLNRQPSD